MTKIATKQKTAIDTLPSTLQEILLNINIDKPLSFSAVASDNSLSFFDYQTVHTMQQATGLNQSELGLALLPLAASFAVTPVSNFHVGAVAFDSNGNAYLGANFEFAGTHIGQTIHAEQSAIAHMWQRGATDLALLVINYAPCGHCRQFINEVNLADDFMIQLPDNDAQPLNHYLPESFGGSDLGIVDKILGDHSVLSKSNAEIISELNFKLSTKNENDVLTLSNIATFAHGACHAPYSDNKSGIALLYENEDGSEEVITGRYAENAAFNPTLPALQVALNYRRLQGKDWQTIKCAVMVETITTLSQQENTQALLRSIVDIRLEHHKL